MANFIYLVLIVALSTVYLYLLHYFAPSLMENDERAQLKFPNSLEELQKVANILKLYSIDHWWYVFLMFGSAYIYKQSFCIPGSLFLNILAGALYGKLGGLFLACLFTVIGASFCYSLSHFFARNVMQKYFSERFRNFQEKVEENRHNLLHFMLFIRLVPLTPGWVINVVAPLVNVPLPIFMATTFIGLGPYNFVGVSAGGILSSLKSVDDVFTWNIFIGITLIALTIGGPTYLLKKNSQKNNVKIS